MMLAAVLAAVLLPQRAAAQTLTLDSALVAVGDGPAFPVDAPARRQALPDEWARSRPGFEGSLWYRVDFQPPPGLVSGELLALSIDQVCSTLQVLLNGQVVHRGGRLVEPYSHQCDRPQLLTLPGALLHADHNTLDIQVVGHRLEGVASRQHAGGLSALRIGPQSALARTHARHMALQVALPQALSATLLLMGGFMFVLGFIHRRDSHLAYFGALSVGWALLGTRRWLLDLPLHAARVEFLLVTLLGLIAWVAVQFLLRSAGQRQPVADRLLPLQAALLPLSLSLVGPDQLYAAASVWYGLLAAEVAVAAAWHLWHQGPAPSSWLMGPLLAAAGVSGAAELVTQWTGMHPWMAQAASVVMPLVLVIVGLRLVRDQGQARHSAERDKADLEERVRAATAEIEHNYRQLSELKVEQITERERKRIAADLHDDLGAKLLTIVHTSDSERISTLAREALEEMRLSVRGLTGKPVRLADALGDWRAEVVSRLAQAGIEGEWDAPEDLPQRLSARAYVQTTRILREATSNIIKHSNASLCSMRCSIDKGDLQFVVQDNGDGISLEIDDRLDRGHGLASMKNRATQLQGQCLVESGPGYGTVIRLTVPLDRAVESA